MSEVGPSLPKEWERELLSCSSDPSARENALCWSLNKRSKIELRSI